MPTESLTMQVKLTAQLQENVQKIRESAEAVTESYTSQMRVVKQLTDALNSLKPEDTASSLKTVNEQAKDVAQNVAKIAGGGNQGFKKLGISLSDVDKRFGGVAKKSAYGVAAFAGFSQGMRNLIAISKQSVKVFGTVASGIGRIGLSILSIPFKMFKALLHEAQTNMGDYLDLLQQIEEVRKQFGQFKQVSAKAIFDVTKTMGGFAETGLSTWRVFGTIAERMQFIRELATGMGVAWSHMVNKVDMKKEGGHILAYMKGLGLAAEEMKGLYNRSVATGEQITDLGVQMTKYSYAMAKAFGLSAKEISRDVGKAIKDVAHFGQLSIKEINVAATYARKLNIEFEKITGTLDAFETFDTAADNASMLAQAFGANVDSFRMMEEQNPAVKIDMLRKAMFAAGKDADKMSRQELKLLSQTTGLDAETTKLAFSFKNQGTSLEEVRKQANVTENAQMKQAEAMQTLAGAIERIVKSGNLREFTGFLDAFIDGMLMGIRSSKEFIVLMRNIWMSLRVTWMEGWKLGRELVNIVPGLKETFTVLTRMFDPKNYRDSAHKVAGILRDFFATMTTGQFSFKVMMDNIQKHFFNFLSAKSPEGQRLLQLAKGMFVHLGDITTQAVKYFSEKLTTGLKELAAILRNPKAWLAGATGAGGDAARFATTVFGPIWDALKESWEPLWEALKEMLSAAWDRVKGWLNSPEFYDNMKYILPGIVAVIAGPAATRVVGMGTVDLFTRGLSIGAEKLATKGAISGAFKSIGTFFSSKLGVVLTGATVAALAVAAGMGISEGMRKFKDSIVGEFSDAQKDIGSGLTGLVDMMTFGLVPDFLLTMIANFGTRAVKALQDVLNNVLGGFGDNIMGFIRGEMKVLGGIGDIIFGIFEGEGGRIWGGVKNILSGLVEMAWNYTRMMFISLPSLIIKYVAKAAFIIPSIVPGLLGQLFTSLGMTKLGKLFTSISRIIRNIGELVGVAIDWVGKGVSWIVDAVSGWFSSLSDQTSFLATLFRIVEKVAMFVVDHFIKIGKIFLETIKKLDEETHMFGVALNLAKFAIEKCGNALTWLGEKAKSVLVWVEDVIDDLDLLADATDRMANGESPFKAWESAKSAKVAKMMADYGKTIGETVSQSAAEAASSESEKSGGFLNSLFGGEGVDVSKDAAGALSFAEDATKRVQDVVKTSQEISIEKLQPVMNKLSETFNKDGPFMHFVQNVNTNVNSEEMKKLGESVDTVAGVFENMQKITKFGSTGDKGAGLINAFTLMSQNLENVGNFANSMQTYAASVQSIASIVTTSGIVPALEAVSSMIRSAESLGEALAEGNVAKLNVKAKLQNVANAVGLGGKANYKIENKGVTINVEFNVTMSAADVERAIIMRSKSVIRDRLNNAKYEGKPQGLTDIPEQPDVTSSPETWFASGHMPPA